jgi:quercetin dioxygenase-like cupin family protein
MRSVHMSFVAAAALACTSGAARVDSAHPFEGALTEAVVMTPPAISWSAAPDVLPAGAQISVLEGDPAQPGFFTLRLRMPDAYRIPPHYHPAVEHVTVVSGTFRVGMGGEFDAVSMTALGPGSFGALPARMQHYAMAEGETVVQLHGIGPWSLTYVNPGDDPRTR